MGLRREDKQRVTRKMVMIEARRLHVSHPGGDPEFAASSGWLGRFMVRNNIIMRSRTTMAQRLPRELGDKVASYISQIRHNPVDAIVSFDGTWARRGHTSHYGVQSVILKGTGCVLDINVHSN